MADDDLQVVGSNEDELRTQAIHSLKKKQNFRTSLIAYILVNAILIGIWAISDAGDFWPIWVIGAWGLALAFQARDTYGRRDAVSEDQVAEEMRKIRGG
ncbi:MAG: 2TM domain-containing protein [Actinobacteria bacterium]|nr:2TM domain-containing protein [Actinomycetota bacterium]